MQVYNRFPVTLVSGQGLYVFDTEGRRYFDAGAGIAVNAFGHCHPKMVASLEAQARKLWHVSNLYHNEPQDKLAKTLCEHSFADYVFFGNSGAEAIECALKIARRYFHVLGQSHKKRIITCEGAFHGRTLACISATGTKTEDGFGTIPDDFDIIPFNNYDSLLSAVTENTAAIMLEPIQGEGGIRSASGEYLRNVRKLCDEKDILLIFDEIQSGMGRTGKLFAFEHAGVTPDICTSAKGIGGGFPLGACLATQKAVRGMVYGTHGSTYGGNALACAVGQTALELILEQEFLDNVATVGLKLKQALHRLQTDYPHLIKEVRGIGLMLGIVLHDSYPVRRVADSALETGLIMIPASDNTLRLLPALIMTKDDVDVFSDLLKKTLEKL